MCARARALFLCCLFAFCMGDFFFRFSFFHFTQNSSTVNPSFFEVRVEEDKEDKEDKDKEENDDEDIIIIIIEAAAAVALQKVLDEIVFSCHRRVDSFDVLGCAELRATTRTKTKSDNNDEGGE